MVQDQQQSNYSFNKLPELEKNQFYLKISLYNHFGEENEKLLNLGIIPIEFNQNQSNIGIGREHFFEAYWKEILFFEKYPLIFENISPSSVSPQFFIQKSASNDLLIVPNSKAINRIYLKVLKDFQESSEITQEMVFLEDSSFFLICNYPLRKQFSKQYNKFLIKIEVNRP